MISWLGSPAGEKGPFDIPILLLMSAVDDAAIPASRANFDQALSR
jgi:hypothetical protein